VGTSFGCFTHVRALTAAGFDVVGLVGRDRAKTEARARQFGAEQSFGSLDDALGLPGVDAVTIATPPHTHAELALTAIRAGKHVICEKPFTRDTEEGRGVLAVAEEAGVVHLMGSEFRWDPGQATLARAISDGLIGEPRLATILLNVSSLSDPAAEVPSWWADAGAGGGWLGAHGSQVIDQIRATLGEFEQVSASLELVADRDQTAEDSFVVHFVLRSGVVGLMASTAGDWGPPVIITRVAGSSGTVWIDGLGSKVWIADRDGSRQVPVDDDLPSAGVNPVSADVLDTAYEQMIGHGLDLMPYTRLAETFRDLILGRAVPERPRPPTFADGVAAMAVLDAIRRSAAERTSIAIGC
jgi:predicted dehydrogenase